MNLAFYDQSTEKAIVEEILQWSETALEKPSPQFNNLPPCPYARKALMDEKVAILFKYDDSYQVLYSCISQFDDNFDLAIIVDVHNDKSAYDFHEYLESLNEAISNGMFIDKDIWVMGFHPDDDVSETAQETAIEAITDTEYSMIFVQRLTVLQEAADKLDKKGYYDSYDSECIASDIYNRRVELYRRLKNGNETS
ncbi:MAG: hypothetical protein GY954_18190 [Alteromonas sp.]|uniref:hypothetical protein n=1 Tax=Oceanicoccus sp. TaxID=2691044 RepID=UPI0026329874|nr:hypothetical protein [Oceanicoccus sp.]MCP3704847.1 hypothetical protein [Alteromonas sp.]MCP3907805.1 hypothetical protein [Oceanicoccus sp.]